MSNEYRKVKVTKEIPEQLLLAGDVADIIDHLQRLAFMYPGCRIVSCYGENSLFWDVLETDQEFGIRIAEQERIKKMELEFKKAQYEQLKKELGLDDEQ